MVDFREHRDAVRAAVRAADEKDKNWKWKVAAINKNEVRIGWGYLEYLGEDGAFVLKEFDGLRYGPKELDEIVGVDAHDMFRVFSFVGDDEILCDAKSIDEGIENVVRNLASEARNCY